MTALPHALPGHSLHSSHTSLHTLPEHSIYLEHDSPHTPFGRRSKLLDYDLLYAAKKRIEHDLMRQSEELFAIYCVIFRRRVVELNTPLLTLTSILYHFLVGGGG